MILFRYNPKTATLCKKRRLTWRCKSSLMNRVKLGKHLKAQDEISSTNQPQPTFRLYEVSAIRSFSGVKFLQNYGKAINIALLCASWGTSGSSQQLWRHPK